MDQNEEERDEVIEQFRRELSRVDEVTQVVLKAHRAVEEHLDSVMAAIFAHPKYLRDMRASFYHKVQLARAYAFRGDDDWDWELILKINSLRNEFAHKLPADIERSHKIGSLRKLLLEWGTLKFREKISQATEIDVIVSAAAVCCGFLCFVENKFVGFRRAIDRWEMGEEVTLTHMENAP